MSEKISYHDRVISDNRHIANGKVIPTKGYCDQPYIVKTHDGAWLMTVTTGTMHEGKAGQHVVSMRSYDKGLSWTDYNELEPSDGPEASYAVLLATPFGRIYCFYNHNTDNIRELEKAKGGLYYRVDSMGHYVFRYSDDGGKSWSADRYEVPMREFEIDRNNHHKGNPKYFWNVGKGFVQEGRAYIPMHKIGEFGYPGGYVKSEGALVMSENLLTEKNPNKISFTTLPDGDVGLRAPEGAGEVAEEQSVVALSDGSLLAVYRTIAGFPAYTYSRDAGKNWDKPEIMRYPDGRIIKHPRAACFVWKCNNGKYLLWFHNNGGRGFEFDPMYTDKPAVNYDSVHYDDRNPAWLLSGIERETDKGMVIEWSQPDIVLYDDDPLIVMSYPDFVEENGEFYITETQKRIARTHYIEKSFLELLWAQHGKGAEVEGLVADLTAGKHNAPPLPEFVARDKSQTAGGKILLRTGISLIIDYSDIKDGDVLISTLTLDKRGIELRFKDGNFVLYMFDGRTKAIADTAEIFLSGNNGTITVIIDAGPHIISFVHNGRFCDGGAQRQFGWLRFSSDIYGVKGSESITVGAGVSRARMLRRAITVSEAVLDYKYHLK